METQVPQRFEQFVEQAAHIVEDISAEIMECESLRAWDEMVYPIFYSTFALYSGAATALIHSAGDMMQGRRH